VAKYSVKVSSQEEANVLVEAYKKYLPGEVVGCFQYDPKYHFIMNYYEPNNPKETNQNRYCLQLLSYDHSIDKSMTSEELIKYLAGIAKTRLMNSFPNMRARYIVFENEAQYNKIKSLIGDKPKIQDYGNYSFRIFNDNSGSFRSREDQYRSLNDTEITFDEMVYTLKLLFDIPDEKETEMETVGYGVKITTQGELDILRILAIQNGFKPYCEEDVTDKYADGQYDHFAVYTDKDYNLRDDLVSDMTPVHEVSLEELINFIITGAVPNTDIEVNGVTVEVSPGKNIYFDGENFTDAVVNDLITLYNDKVLLTSNTGITDLETAHKFKIGRFKCSVIPGKQIVIGCTTFEKAVVERIIAKWNS